MVQLLYIIFTTVFWKEISIIALVILVLISLVVIIQNSKFKLNSLDEFEIKNFDHTGLSEIDQLNGFEFEHYCADYLRKNDFINVKVTKGSNDFGIDVLAEKNNFRYAVQCKRYEKNVSRAAVSEAVAGKQHYGCDIAMVFTNSYLSKSAKKMARSTSCEIIDRDHLLKWTNKLDLNPIDFNIDKLCSGSGNIGVKNHTNSRADNNFIADTQSSFLIRDPLEPKADTPKVFGKRIHYLGADTATKISNFKSNVKIEKILNKSDESTTATFMKIFFELTDDIKRQIKEYAEKEHPGDYSTQLYVVNEGIGSYEKLRDIEAKYKSNELFCEIAKEALKKYEPDYSTALYVVEDQLQDYERLNEI